MKTLVVILPIFIIIAAGWLARKRNFIPDAFILKTSITATLTYVMAKEMSVDPYFCWYFF